MLIEPAADDKSADLTIVDRLASILVSMQAFQDYSAGLHKRHKNDDTRRVRAGEFNDIKEKLDFQNRFRAVPAEAKADWKRLQDFGCGGLRQQRLVIKCGLQRYLREKAVLAIFANPIFRAHFKRGDSSKSQLRVSMDNVIVLR